MGEELGKKTKKEKNGVSVHKSCGKKGAGVRG